MIRLTIQTESAPKTIAFDKPVVIIGSGSSQEVDLTLPGENLQSIHVKIIEQNGRYTVINAANDPFVTLNSLPFGKKALQPLDILQIGHTIIRFEGVSNDATSSTTDRREENSATSIERIHEALERTIATARSEEILADDEIEDLIREVETLAADDEADPSLMETTIASPLDEEPYEIEQCKPDEDLSLSTRIDQKMVAQEQATEQNILVDQYPNDHSHVVHHPNEDSYIFDLEDEGNGAGSDLNGQEAQDNIEAQSNWNLLVIVFIAIATIAAVAVVAAYITISDRSGIEKMTAAEGVADVAMALTYAQVHHIKPQKQNWSDPEFLKNNLSSILPPEYPTFANFDNQGQFTNCPYILRIYTSSDLSQFLVIAQPEPSFLQWLIPKTAIIVDSRAMEMRNINDLKALNRLLLNANTLDGANALDISELVKQGTLIPLSTLATRRENLGFAPPKALSLIKPGSENRLYNAPRYYHFTESVLVRAVNLLQIVGNSYEVARFKQDLQAFAAFPDLVLYSTQGIQKTLQAQKALSTLAPHNEFLTAYLNFDREGYMTNSQLLLNDDYPLAVDKVANKDSTEQQGDVGQEQNDHNVMAMMTAPTVPALKFDGGIDHNNPLFLQMIAVAKARQQALKPINDQLTSLLNNHTEQGSIGFVSRFAELWKQYKSEDKLQKVKVTEALKTLYTESGNMPLAQFVAYVRAAGLEALAKSSLASHAKATGDMQMTTEQIHQQMVKIQRSNNFSSLESNVKETAEMLSLARLPDAEKLILFQNQMRMLTLERLRDFILSAKSPLVPADFSDGNRAILSGILENAWVNDSDEFDYYIHEFEMRMENQVADSDSKTAVKKTPTDKK